MGETAEIYKLVLFSVLLGVVVAGLGLAVNSSGNVLTTGFTDTNNTVINSTVAGTTVQVCQQENTIPVIGALLWGASCMLGGIGTFFNVITSGTLTTGTPWFDGFILAMVVSGIMLVVSIFRGR